MDHSGATYKAIMYAHYETDDKLAEKSMTKV